MAGNLRQWHCRYLLSQTWSFHWVTSQQYQLAAVVASYHKINHRAALKSILLLESRMEEKIWLCISPVFDCQNKEGRVVIFNYWSRHLFQSYDKITFKPPKNITSTNKNSEKNFYFKGKSVKICPKTMHQILTSYHKIPDDSYSPGEGMKPTQ